MIPNFMAPFVEMVLAGADLDDIDYEILDYDLDRIYLAVGGKENNYDIRMWDVLSDEIVFTFLSWWKTTEKRLLEGIIL